MRDYEQLSSLLRQYRNDKSKSLSDIAAAINVDRSYISKIENGHERPAESILNKLISYYSLSQVEANELWTLAGYRHGLVAKIEEDSKGKGVKNMNEQSSEIQIKVPEDKMVLYTDSAFVTTSKYGVVIDFAQSMGPTNQQTVVSRIGMSKEHARALLAVLTKEVNQDNKLGDGLENDKKKGKNQLNH